MIGTAADPGVMVLAFRDLFARAGRHAEEHRVKHNVLVSFLEIYNENIFDLLVRVFGGDFLSSIFSLLRRRTLQDFLRHSLGFCA